MQLEFLKSCFLIDRHFNQHTANYEILEHDDLINEFLNCHKLRSSLIETDIKNNKHLLQIIKLCNSLIYIYDKELVNFTKQKLPKHKRSDEMNESPEELSFLIDKYLDFWIVSVSDFDIFPEYYKIKYKETTECFTTEEIRLKLDEIIETITFFHEDLNKYSIDTNLYEDVFYAKYSHYSPWNESGLKEDEFEPIIDKLKYEKANLNTWDLNFASLTAPDTTDKFENPTYRHPKLNPFANDYARKLFLKLHDRYKDEKMYSNANYSFIYYAMKNDALINSSGVYFIDYLASIDILIDRIDSRQSGSNKRTPFYEECKTSMHIN